MKRILITGVSRGLGRAMCEAFSGRDCDVRGCARNEAAIAELHRELGPDRFSVVDISDCGQVDQWAKDLKSLDWVPDLLLNNAAIINENNSLWEVPPDEFQRLIDINIFGSFAVIRSILPMMIERGSGGVVNFSSTWGRSTSPQVAPYCASKFAIEGMTQSLADELPAGMFTVALNPGIINTAMLQTCFGESASHYVSPSDWAETAVPFLLNLGPQDNGKSLTAP